MRDLLVHAVSDAREHGGTYTQTEQFVSEASSNYSTLVAPVPNGRHDARCTQTSLAQGVSNRKTTQISVAQTNLKIRGGRPHSQNPFPLGLQPFDVYVCASFVLPPDRTTLPYRSFRISTSHFMIELNAVSSMPAASIPTILGVKRTSGQRKRSLPIVMTWQSNQVSRQFCLKCPVGDPNKGLRAPPPIILQIIGICAHNQADEAPQTVMINARPIKETIAPSQTPPSQPT